MPSFRTEEGRHVTRLHANLESAPSPRDVGLGLTSNISYKGAYQLLFLQPCALKGVATYNNSHVAPDAHSFLQCRINLLWRKIGSGFRDHLTLSYLSGDSFAITGN